MKIKIAVFTVLLFLIALTSFAEKTPKIVTDGMDAYKEKGYEEAFNIWLKNSTMESDKELLKNLKNATKNIESVYGKIKRYEILTNIKVSSDTTRTYAQISYEKGPIFLYFDCFKTDDAGWVIPVMRMHSEIDRVLPESVVNRK